MVCELAMKSSAPILTALVLINLGWRFMAGPVDGTPGGNPVPQFFFIAGEGVSSIGKFTFHDGMTVTNALKMAGGFVRFVPRHQVELTRKGETQPFIVDVGQIEGGLTNDVKIQPDDRLYVRGPIVIRKRWLSDLQSQGTNTQVGAGPESTR
jgi:SLBB domain